MLKIIKVLIVDDSAVVRQVLQEMLAGQADIEVIGAASDPYIAVDKMRGNWPDVITLDIEMPRMDGITFLRKIMTKRPTPVVICSSLTETGAQTTIEAMSAGAVAIFTKPQLGVKKYLETSRSELLEAVRSAAGAKVQKFVPHNKETQDTVSNTNVNFSNQAMTKTTETVIAIGTSTGGTTALEYILKHLEANSAGIIIVQHMPERFTAAFAARLNSICKISVKEAQHGDRVRPGLALIAPGGKHLSLTRSGAFYYVSIKAGPAVNRHCPSVDVMFRSVAKVAGQNACGIILTGMGADGAKGLLAMRQAGSFTAAQNEQTAVVFGMPKEAIKLGAAMEVIGLDEVPRLIMQQQNAV
ncbi:chemotaxis response regulator protein-glutamate methylesterase [Pseudoalteromonas mariniglutinosa]|uniref:protein-glutamate methylesterase/protein-glutamine glutaminase n=1 Tax=Pseudoalteromonas mariniglutinosa TaxID=206042 RepID=UPI003850FC65